MKDDYTTNSHHLTYTHFFQKVGGMHFLNLGVHIEGLNNLVKFKSPTGGLLSLKHLSLVILTVQNAASILLMRYTRTRAGDLYITSTAVTMTELLKLVTSSLILLTQKRSVVEWLKYLFSQTLGQPLDMLKMAVPAGIYTVQNNLLYIALSNLDAATFQVRTLKDSICLCYTIALHWARFFKAPLA